jgi:hypothetical protein
MRRDRRKSFRVEWNSSATIYDANRHLERPCILSDFSSGGAKISGVRANTIPDAFKLRIAHDECHARTCRVIWRTEHALGVEFTDRLGRENNSTRDEAVWQPTPNTIKSQ